MRKKVVTIKSDKKKQGVFCDVSGNVMEILTSHLALTENVIKLLKDDEEGPAVLKSLLKDTIALFIEHGIIEKDIMEEKND